MSEHTPGPWHVTSDQWIEGPHREMVSCAYGGTMPGTAYDVTTSQPIARANARLIAAAPDLLDALIFACFRLEEVGLSFDEIDNAIDKATGNE